MNRTTVNRTSDSLNKALSYSSCLFLDVNFDHVGYFYIINIVTLVANLVFAVVAVMANSLIMYVIWKTAPLHSPSNALLCCLAFADFLVGILAQPAFAIHKIGEMEDNFSIYCITRVMSETVGLMAAGVSILTLTAISVERLLALRLHLRYKEIVTTTRILKITGIFWIAILIIVSSRFVISNDKIFNSFAMPILLVSLLVTIIAYVQIFRCVVRHQAQIKTTSSESSSSQPDHPTGSRRGIRSFNFLKYKKSTLTMSYILGLFLLCYVPCLVVMMARRMMGYTSNIKIAYVSSTTLVYLNSSINPLVYCWRISDIRLAVKRTLRKMTNAQGELSTGLSGYDRSSFRNTSHVGSHAHNLAPSTSTAGASLNVPTRH